MKRLLIYVVCCCYSLLLMAATNRNAISAFKLLDISDRQNTNIEYTSTSEFPLNDMPAIYGLSISGHSQLNSDTSLVRVLLVDNQGKSYLVYEDFYLTASNMAFQDMAFETAYLDSVTPDKLKIIIRDATLYLNDVSFSYGDEAVTRNSGIDRKVLAKTQQQTQEEYMIDCWNEYNEANNELWFAGKTALSGLSYESKKAALGATSDAYQSDGLEYYVGGIYVMRSYDDSSTNRSIVDSIPTSVIPSYNTYVESFDWRNRHGRNWMTSVKNQKEPDNPNSIGNGGCWAFAACSAIEASINLQFNMLLEYDLSEQELGSCSDGTLVIPTGGSTTDALDYIKYTGVVTEECMPFLNNDTIPCSNKCDNPQDIIRISNYEFIPTQEDLFKYKLINFGPITGRINNKYLKHMMCLCGYGTIHEGDTLRYLYYDKAPVIYPIETGNPLIGKTYWIYKNSYGLNNKGDESGYMYVIFERSSFQDFHYVIGSNIISSIYNEDDVICEDRDGDGYYFWGLGEKPAHCPSCAPDTPDGDDSNPNLTVMNEYGQFLPMINRTESIIFTNTTWNTNDTLCGDVYIQDNATLTITNASITLHPLSHILVEEGTTLIVDNATIVNAEIIVQDGGSLIIRNNGIIQQGEDDKVDIQLGGIMQIESGEIRIVE
ncbi:MAG: hypothetical protein E7075_09855 [Bacteroidales bacterium]|nr:hypothetical protein [Bacteroidales bacterium]